MRGLARKIRESPNPPRLAEGTDVAGRVEGEGVWCGSAATVAVLAIAALGCMAPSKPDGEPDGMVAESSAPGLTVRLSDQDKDGRNDSLLVMDGATEVLSIQGKDIGGVPSWIEVFDERGERRFRLIDRNQDGEIDLWERRELNGLVTVYKDQDYDGEADEVVRGLRSYSVH